MSKRILSGIFILICISLYICPIAFAREIILENGTKIQLKLLDKISSGSSNEGDEVNFVVVDDVKFGNNVLIKAGTGALGIISELTPRGRVGKPGKIAIILDSTMAITGQRVPLTGMITKKGDDNIVMSAALSATIFPIFLLMRGSDAQLPAGYQIQARVDRDVILLINDIAVPVINKK